MFDQTPLCPEYSPVQHRGAARGSTADSETKPFVNVMPLARSSFCMFGMYCSSSHRWSSVRMNTMFGLLGRFGEAAPASCVVPAMRAVATTANGMPYATKPAGDEPCRSPSLEYPPERAIDSTGAYTAVNPSSGPIRARTVPCAETAEGARLRTREAGPIPGGG